jgi:hypothetical protein
MFTDKITYQNFNGEEETEEFFFHLSASDIARIELMHQGLGKTGMIDELNRIIKKQNGAEIIAAFEGFVKDSYGIKSDDGRRFIKTDEVYQEFRSSGAYDVFFLKLVTDAEFGAKFINGLLPEDLRAQAEKLMEDQKGEATLKAVAPLSAEDFGHDDAEGELIVEEVPRPRRRRDRTKQELLAAYRAKQAAEAQGPDYTRMSEEDALKLSQEDFYKWLNAQPE